ncbi:protein disks lost [Musca domestica]|uniref:Protein disks lost n=1 Tax=Musca domestica TaxID=7370 RepID=A0A1I8MLQ6_MUSDO|nr:protein disks lost [Musca domestica]
MSSLKAEEKLQTLIDYNHNNDGKDKNHFQFRCWFMKQFEETHQADDDACSLEDFTVYFLNSLRQHTEAHLKATGGVGGSDTPKCQTPVKTAKPNLTQDDSLAARFLTSYQDNNTSTPNKSIRNELSQTSHADWTSNSMPRLSTSVDRSNASHKNLTSTPVKRNVSGNNSRRLSTTPGSTNKSASTSICLGDFLVVNTSTGHNRSNKKKNTSATNVTQGGGGGGVGGAAAAAEKPKKRVQPISISKKVDKSANNSSVFAGESSFSNENNILKISHTEVEDKEQCAILAARKILKSNASEITKELVGTSPAPAPGNALASSGLVVASTPTKSKNLLAMDDMSLDFEDLAENKLLHRLADIYVILIDNHLTTNFLNDLSFLLNLLNAMPSVSPDIVADAFKKLELQETETNPSKILQCLENLRYAIYFALLSLCQLKERLVQLDSKTLKVVLTNERFSYFPEATRSYLLDIYQRKQQIIAENPMHDASFCLDTKTTGQNNVYFQHEQDSRHNFTSQQEFANFRPQRDLFCKCLKLWEANHLNPNWKFAVEIKPIIREIFQQSENCVNMAHFAKLFVSQLLLSASSAATPEEIGLEVDLQKFSKLTQRLIAPSQFSVDYQFPRAQAFFRDFILNSRSLAFVEQLKMELYSELLSLNDSTFDHISITKADNEPDNNDNSLIADMGQHEQVAVRPDVLNSMLILAKFLGFTICMPFVSQANGSNVVIPPAMEKKQLRLRSLIQPGFDLHTVLQEGIEQGKLLITIPWMVQYLCMLDSITIQLEIYIKTLKLMFALYWYLGGSNVGKTSLNPTSCFMIASCLGWLFDSQQYLIEQYYQFRSDLNENKEILDYLKAKLESGQEDGQHQQICPSSAELNLNPLLESLLPVACPFLGEFRVSIMPAKYAQTKYASRTGRYRHITTRLAELSPAAKEGNKSSLGSPLDTSKTTQKNLMQAFRQVQNSSTRQMLGFCAERAYKCVVKDGQLKILLPAKSNADSEVNEICSCDYPVVLNKITKIYATARRDAIAQWNEAIPKMLDKRIKNSLDSLLPEETPNILKKTYFMLIKNDAEKKISQWFYGNILRDNYFCVELQSMANKLCSVNKTKQPSELKIVKEVPRVSELIDNLQYWLHCTSLRIELFKDSKPIVDLMHNIVQSFENVLPTILYRLMATNIIQLLQHIITANCGHLTTELIEASCQVLIHPNMRKALETSSQNSPKNTDEEQQQLSSATPAPNNAYDGLVTIAFLQTLALRSECYTAFGTLLIAMIRRHVISLSYTNSLFVNIFKYDWHPQQLNEISNMLRNIAQNTKDVSNTCSDDSIGGGGDDEDDDEKSNLFMDMLADLSRDIDLY